MNRQAINTDAKQVQADLNKALAGNQQPFGKRGKDSAEQAAQDKRLGTNPAARKIGGVGPNAL